jgi:hypothetical protein
MLCRYVECCYAECRGVNPGADLLNKGSVSAPASYLIVFFKNPCNECCLALLCYLCPTQAFNQPYNKTFAHLFTNVYKIEIWLYFFVSGNYVED